MSVNCVKNISYNNIFQIPIHHLRYRAPIQIQLVSHLLLRHAIPVQILEDQAIPAVKNGRQEDTNDRKAARNTLKGYKGFVDFAYIGDVSDYNASKIELSTTHGYQFNNYFFVGGGVAFNYYTDADLYAAPIYANFRANFINKKVTPFADVKAGYAVGDIEGAYASIGVGVRFSLKGKKALNLALMYNFQDYDATTDYSYSYGGHYYHNSWNDTWELHGVGARFGFEF